MNSTNTSGAQAPAATALQGAMSDSDYEAWARMLRVVHGDEDMAPETVLHMLQMEETHAVVHGRAGIFLDTSGPWMRISAPAEQPDSTLLRQAMRRGGVIR